MDDPASDAPDAPLPDHARGDAAPPPRRSALRFILAVAIILTGLVWIGQGLGILTAGGSFMIGDPVWAWIGLGFVGLGAVLAALHWRR